jgi:penicillin V acylase-like amidase (Ntn superfamily)
MASTSAAFGVHMLYLRAADFPFGAPYQGFGVYNTEFRTVMNLTNKRYYFELTNQPNVIWADLSKFAPANGAPVMILDPHDPEMSGNVSGRFQKAQKAPF